MKKLIISSMIMFSFSGLTQNLILDGQTIPLNQSTPMSIDSATGDIRITSLNGALSCQEVGDEPTVSLVASPTVVNSGGTTRLTWNVGNNATSCTRTGDWSGEITGGLVSNGSHFLDIANITSNSSFGISCTNNFGTSPIATANVNIAGNPACTNRPPILNGNEDRTIRLIPGAPFNGPGVPQNPASYNGLYTEIVNGGGDWPGETGGQSFATLTSGQYIAMQFTTSNVNEEGKINMVAPSNGQGPGSGGITMSLSECPGDFSMTNVCRTVGGGSPSLRWSLDPNENPNLICKLEKNTTYYFNIVHSNSTGNNFSTTSCNSTEGYCGIIFNNQ